MLVTPLCGVTHRLALRALRAVSAPGRAIRGDPEVDRVTLPERCRCKFESDHAGLYSGESAILAGKDLIQGAGVEHTLPPGDELIGIGLIQAIEDGFRQRAEALLQ